MELRRLELFVAVCEELHFGRAAARVHMSQPGLSHQMSRLEGELEVQLFDRSHRRVTLTDAGRALLERAPRLLADARLLAQYTRDVGSGRIGRLRVGFVGSTMLRLVPQVLRSVREHWPDVVLSVIERSTSTLVDELQHGTLDAAFIYNLDTDYSGLRVVSVGEEPVGVALPTAHPLAHRRALKLRDLADENFVLFPREIGPDNYDRLLEHCRADGFTPKMAQEAESVPTILGLVASGLGVAFASQTVMETLQREGVRFVKLRPAPRIGMALAYPTAVSNPVLQSLRDEVERQTGRTT